MEKMVTVKIEVQLSEKDVKRVQAVLDGSEEGQGSYGKLDMNRLVQMLLGDVALTIRRPGSWEGANMLRVLEAHGYPDVVLHEDLR